MNDINVMKGYLIASVISECDYYLADIESNVKRNILKHELYLTSNLKEIGFEDNEKFNPYLLLVKSKLPNIVNKTDIVVAAKYIEENLTNAGYHLIVEEFFNHLERKEAVKLSISW